MGALAALAYGGFAELDGVAQWVVGLGAPLVAAVVGGSFVAPMASHPTVDPVRLLLELAVFTSGVAALLLADRPGLAMVFAALVVIHLRLTFALGQRPARPAR